MKVISYYVYKVIYLLFVFTAVPSGDFSGMSSGGTSDLFVLSPSNITVTEMDRVVLTCVPANSIFQASWISAYSNFSFFTFGPNNYYLLIENVERTFTISCSVNNVLANATVTVQG